MSMNRIYIFVLLSCVGCSTQSVTINDNHIAVTSAIEEYYRSKFSDNCLFLHQKDVFSISDFSAQPIKLEPVLKVQNSFPDGPIVTYIEMQLSQQGQTQLSIHVYAKNNMVTIIKYDAVKIGVNTLGTPITFPEKELAELKKALSEAHNKALQGMPTSGIPEF